MFRSNHRPDVRFVASLHLSEFSCVSISPRAVLLLNALHIGRFFSGSLVQFTSIPIGITVAKSGELDLIRRSLLMKRQLAIALSAILTAVSFGLPATATAQSTTQIEKIRAKVQVLAASKDSQVQVKFRDQTKLKGYIDSVDPISFTLKDPKNGTSQTIAYSEVESVTKAGSGISTKTWLIVGGIAAGAVTTWLIVKPAVCDGGAQTRGIC